MNRKPKTRTIVALEQRARTMSNANGDLLELVGETTDDDSQQLRVHTGVHGKALVDVFLKVMGNAPEIDDLALLNECGRTTNETLGALMAGLTRPAGTAYESEYVSTALCGFMLGALMQTDREVLSSRGQSEPYQILHAMYRRLGEAYVKRTVSDLEEKMKAEAEGRNTDPGSDGLQVQTSASGGVILSSGMANPDSQKSAHELAEIARAARDATLGRTRGDA